MRSISLTRLLEGTNYLTILGKAILEYYYRQTLKQEGVHLKELTPDLIYSKWSEIEEVSFKILQYT